MQTQRAAMRRVTTRTDERIDEALWPAYQRCDKSAVTQQLLQHSLKRRGERRVRWWRLNRG